MAGFTVIVPNIPNGYVTPPGGSSVGASVDSGATQSGTDLTVDIAGSGSDVVDLQESQDNANWTFLHRLSGTDASLTIQDVARYFRAVRQTGTASVSLQLGKQTSAATPGVLAYVNGGNSFGAAATIGPLDANTFTVGGLGVSTSTVLTSAVNQTTSVTTAGTGTLFVTSSGSGGVVIQAATTGGVTVNSGTGASSFAANATDHATSVGGSTGGSQLNLAAGTNGVGIQAQGAGPIVILGGTGTSSFDVGAGGTLNLGTSANAKTINIGIGAAIINTTIGNATGTTRIRVNTGTGGFGVNVAPDPSAMADFNGTTTQGLRLMVLTTTQKNAIAAPVIGLIVYDTTLGKLCIYNGAWQTVTSV